MPAGWRSWVPLTARVAAAVAGMALICTACSALSIHSGVVVDCSPLLHFDGRTYYGYGDVTVIPPPSRRLGTGTFPPCKDTGGTPRGHARAEKVPVRLLSRLDPRVAVVVRSDQVFIAKHARFPERIRKYFDRVECVTRGHFEVTGVWTAVSPHVGSDLRAPYHMTMLVTAGDGPAMRYHRAYLEVHVTDDTAPTLHRSDVRTALWKAGTVMGKLHCRGTRFVADSLVAKPPVH